jgi:hypothetical protein
MNNKNIVIKCDCLGHSIELEHMEDTNEIELSVWHYGNDGRELNWKERLRWCWRILRTGMPWADMIILSSDKMEKIIKWHSNIKKSEKQLLLDSKK